VFTGTGERAISNYIIDTSLTPSLLFIDVTFVGIVMQPFLEKYQNLDPMIECQSSSGFICEFKKRNQFSSRRAHPKRGPTVSDDDREYRILTLPPLLDGVPNHQRIITVDESCWHVQYDDFQMWAPTESQNVQAFCNGDEKASFPVVAAITTARTKLPLTLIATQKNHIVEESHFGDIGHHRTGHSESGWTTIDAFQWWSAWLRRVYNDRDPLWPVLDCYPVRRQTVMKEYRI
jgi:hypothetical protein